MILAAIYDTDIGPVALKHTVSDLSLESVFANLDYYF